MEVKTGKVSWLFPYAAIADMRQKRILSTVLNAAGDCDGRRRADGRRREIGILH